MAWGTLSPDIVVFKRGIGEQSSATTSAKFRFDIDISPSLPRQLNIATLTTRFFVPSPALNPSFGSPHATMANIITRINPKDEDDGVWPWAYLMDQQTIFHHHQSLDQNWKMDAAREMKACDRQTLTCGPSIVDMVRYFSTNVLTLSLSLSGSLLELDFLPSIENRLRLRGSDMKGGGNRATNNQCKA